MYQIVEKDDFGTDWAPVRYHNASTRRFQTEEEALEIAKDYLTDRNVRNALAAAEKEEGAEAWMLLPDGIFLGVLDGKDWYMKYAKDTVDPKTKQVVAHKGDNIKDEKYYKLEGKTRVAVRVLPGT